MYGKIYPSTYTGSLYGTGAMVLALWPYVIANARIDEGSKVELNPQMLSGIFGEPIEKIERAIEFLCSSDGQSRTDTMEGRRLIKTGSFAYKVVNLVKYRDSECDDSKRQYWKEYRRKRRAKGKDLPKNTNKKTNVQVNANPVQVNVQHADADADADADKREESTHAHDASIPTLPEVLVEAQFRCYPESSARAFFNYHEDKNLWLNQFERPIKWKSYLKNWVINDRATGRVSGNGKAEHRFTDRVFTETKLKALQDVIDSHPANKESAHYKTNSTEEDRQDLKFLRQKLKDIKSQVARS